MSDKEILRRIAERGLSLAQEKDKQFIDIFQHMLDEIDRLPNVVNEKYIIGDIVSEEELKTIKKGLKL